MAFSVGAKFFSGPKITSSSSFSPKSKTFSVNKFNYKVTYRTVYNPSTSWSHVEQGPEDPILGLSQAFQKDTHPLKVNLGVGAYRDDNGKPYTLKCVSEAEKRVIGTDHEYAPIVGTVPIRQVSAELIFGKDSSVIRDGRNVTAQAISGTGALRIAGQYLSRFLPNTPIYLPKPTWANHIPIFKDSGIEVREYTYYNPTTCGLKYEELLNDINSAPEGSIFLYHACAHNPTGVDPNPEQWKEISRVTKAKKHYALFDCAYQGFASGDCEKDVFAVRQFIEDGHNIAVCQSFAKNFGLYGERVGAFSIVAASKEEAARVESQLKILIRPMYSNPPIYGAKVVSTILSDPALKSLWLDEVKLMSGRIIKMRDLLVSNLTAAGSQRNWSHITSQIGMFCFTGLTPEQCDRLKNEYHIYLTRNGRISVAGVTSGNVEYVSKSIHEVTK